MLQSRSAVIEEKSMQSFHDVLRSKGHLVPLPSALEANLDTQWRALTEAANKAFEHHDNDSAVRFYREAIDTAEQMFEAALKGGSPLLAPMVYNIACANAAECAAQTGNRLGARKLLLRATDKLLTTAKSPSSPFALRINCVRHLRYSLQILDRDFGADNAQPDMKGLLESCAAVSKKIQRVAQWLLRPHHPPKDPDAAAGLPSAASMH
jgi:hypothetical protein